MRVTLLNVLGFLASATGFAQAPAGSIIGVISDQSEAVVPRAVVTATNVDTGLRRAAITGSAGGYAIAALPSGDYELKAEAPGMSPAVRRATVAAGSDTTVNMTLTVAGMKEVLTVAGASPQIQYGSNRIAGVLTRMQIEQLPLNGRNVLELAKLEPGVTLATPNTGGGANRQLQVSVLGSPSARTRITADGGDISNYITGENSLNLSQDLVQEFQVATVNFDVATGVTGVGAVNIVSRSGGNDFHGGAFFLFRDHYLAAYPALRREPSNPNPYFARRQTGFHVGGPVRRNRLFFFVNLEQNNQDSVVTVQPAAPEFARFGRIAPSPFDGKQIDARFDARLNPNHSLFLRYSHEGNHSFSPPFGAITLPSNWLKETNCSDQSVAGWTGVLRPNLVSDLRFSFTYWQLRDRLPSAADCPGCIGLGLARVEVQGTGLVFGNYDSGGADLRRVTATEGLTWQKGSHMLRWGMEWEYYRSAGTFNFFDPASMLLYSPETVRLHNSDPGALPIPLPSAFNTVDDVLRLPLVSFVTGFGEPSQPPPFQADTARQNNRWLFYWHDAWRVRPSLTLNFGLRYSLETNAVNTDLDKPAFLAPILGQGGLGASRPDRNNFGPSAGLAWRIAKDGKTVFRAGAGIYYDTVLQIDRLRERSVIGPRGNGRIPIDGSLVPNLTPGIPGVPLLQPLSFTSGPTAFTGAHLLSFLPVGQGLLQQIIGPPGSDLTVRNIDVFKQGVEIIPTRFPMPYSEHVSAGAQREITRDLVVSADFVFRQFIHTLMSNVDYNLWDSVRGPMIPACSGLQLLDLLVRCSSGPVGVHTPGGRSHYRGLLIKLDKRYSRRTQFLISYALSSNAGFNGVTNKLNWFESFGPLDTDRRHVLTASGVFDLHWGMRLSLISSISSQQPFTAFVGAVDFNGDGTNGDVLPGSRYNQFNRGFSESTLATLVNQFNRDYAGRKTLRGQAIPTLSLPGRYRLGDGFSSQDLRIGKTLKFRDRYSLMLLVEAFNILNVANLTGFSGDLAQPATFGQPASRVQQVFGSGGPRAFQLGGRFSF